VKNINDRVLFAEERSVRVSEIIRVSERERYEGLRER